MPCFNEQQTLGEAVQRVYDVVTEASLDAELIILDDQSKDDTLRIATDLIDRYPTLHIRVFHRVQGGRGFGAVVRYGMAHATGRYCALVSADALDPVQLLPQMVRQLRAGAQHVQVSRYTRTEDARTVPLKYRLYQRVYRSLVRVLLGTEIKDSTYGFRAFNRVYVQALGTSSNRFNLCPEITFKVILSGGKNEYIPGHPVPFQGGGSAKFQLPREGWGYLYVLVRATLHRVGILWF
jgi:glycosyltransferase involved in cell wall biosynthesis